MSEFCDGPLLYRAVVRKKPATDIAGQTICVYLQFKHKNYIFAIVVGTKSGKAREFSLLRCGDVVYVSRKGDEFGQVEYQNAFMRLWNRLFW